MDQMLYVVVATVQTFISFLMMLLFLRALLGFFAEEDSKLLVFSSIVTEPVVAPVRTLLSKIPALEDSPIDFSFMATYLILIIVRYALPVSF